MKHEEQINIVDAIIDNVRDELVKTIKSGSIPDHWNGIELRELIADKIIAGCKLRKYKAKVSSDYLNRGRNFENEVIVRNL